MKVLGVIPARYASSRFPGKSLAEIDGKSMIQRVYEQAAKSNVLDHLVIATDDERIFEHAQSFGANVLMTSINCKNGTERCAEVAAQLTGPYDIVINIQGDEPLLQPAQLDQLVNLIYDHKCEIATLAHALENEEINNHNIVKVSIELSTEFDGIALGFSRDHEFIANTSDSIYKHIGLYAFRKECLEKIVALQPSPNEVLEHLEQLRWVDHGYQIAVGITTFPNLSVDVPEDIHKILALLKVNREN